MADQITLKVSDRTFVTSRSTLVNGTQGGSHYFASLFDPNNAHALQALTIKDDKPTSTTATTTSSSTQHHSPTYFLDLDPRLFALVLDYLRSGIMPFLWHEDRGFDHITYAKLERLAAHLQIPRLLDWIRRKMYLQAIQQVYTADMHTLGKGIGQKSSAQFAGGPEKVVCSVTRSGDWGASVVVVKKWTNVDNRVLFDELR